MIPLKCSVFLSCNLRFVSLRWPKKNNFYNLGADQKKRGLWGRECTRATRPTDREKLGLSGVLSRLFVSRYMTWNDAAVDRGLTHRPN